MSLLNRHASTRSSALIRIGLVLLLWNRFAAELAPWFGLEPERMVLSVSFFASTSLLLAGWHTRLAAAWTAATMVTAIYGFGVYGDVEPWRHHHTTLLAAASVLVALTPCGGSYSVDRWLAVRAARRAGQPPPAERGPVWALTLIALQVAAVYLWSALDKCSLPFLTGYKLDRIFVYLYFGFRPEHPLWAPMMSVLACATLVLEVLLPIGLFTPSLRRWAIPVGIALHAVFYLLLPVGTFSLTMILMYLAFFDPDDVHAIIDNIADRK